LTDQLLVVIGVTFLVMATPGPDRDRIQLVAKRLIVGDQPLFITSDDLYRSDAINEAVELVEMLGVPILDAGSPNSNSGFPSWHSLYWDNKAFGRRNGIDPFDRYDVIVGLGADEFTNTGARGEEPPVEIGRAPNSWKAAIGVDMEKSGHFAGMYLGDPNIDFVGLAKSQGVNGEKADTASDLEAALKRGIAATRRGESYIVEVMISRIGGADSTWYQAFNLAETRTRNV
jgi:thiamine pyrophosphate-dependent acetolactate synthase large subunit-like protein